MIEIPEAVNLTNQINDTIKSKKIKKVITAKHPHKFAWYHKEGKDYDKILKQKTITNAITQGSFVEIQAEDSTILYTEGINLRYFDSVNNLPEKHQLLIEFEDETFLCASVQMYGGLICFEGDTYDDKYYNTAKEKPSPLSDDFNIEYFNALCSIAEKRKTINLKSLLATKQNIPGLGNGVLQDILYNAELHPKQKFNLISQDQRNKLFDSIKTILKEMTEKGGRDTEKDLFGNPGGYITSAGKNTVGKPCKKCKSPIVKESFMGGSIYYCSDCQNIKK